MNGGAMDMLVLEWMQQEPEGLFIQVNVGGETKEKFFDFQLV